MSVCERGRRRKRDFELWVCIINYRVVESRRVGRTRCVLSLRASYTLCNVPCTLAMDYGLWLQCITLSRGSIRGEWDIKVFGKFMVKQCRNITFMDSRLMHNYIFTTYWIFIYTGMIFRAFWAKLCRRVRRTMSSGCVYDFDAPAFLHVLPILLWSSLMVVPLQ